VIAAAFAVVVGACGFAQWKVLAQEAGKPGDVALALQPGHGWTLAAPEPGSWTPRFTAPSGALRASYVRGAERVGVYVAYYRHQSATRKLVSTENTLVPSDDGDWSRTLGREDAFALGTVPIAARAVRIVSTRDRGDIDAWQFYWINGRLTASDVLAKAYTAWSQLVAGRDDSAMVIVHADGPDGRRAVQQFLTDEGAAILAMLDEASRQP
jgi:EpsI family protein